MEARITPACAGKSRQQNRVLKSLGDHPRVCGEKFIAPQVFMSNTGSPPRVQGKGSASWTVNRKQRITPACAGKRIVRIDYAPRVEDHPRVCGEKFFVALKQAMMLGSPPRVRGKVKKGKKRYIIDRITPACAGKRHFASSAVALTGDHPRVCGEKYFQAVYDCLNRGSPPRVRGKD